MARSYPASSFRVAISVKSMKDNRRWLGILLLMVASPAAESLGARPSPSARRVPLAVAQARGPEAAPNDAELRATTRRGIARLMDGNPNGATETSRQLQKPDPQSPPGNLF